ncbi:MAG: hypothetical protein EWV48_14640 [Microcystis aeruginosa Ma_QC_C_20070823_S13]|nr:MULTISPECIES: hypothetical protein [unclassified Microcystis]TRU59507.1 MAG: hypothetical protein EWV48_14640 [Microcystis aeruginosa Ma_QC_C_20070823_S13]TRU60359.1 MAG: hypothetical protein EWV56_11300 [Microcystis aeruginosa Ma_QC_C_20070823_S13D]
MIKASRSESAQSKERKKRNQENIPVHSFRTLLEDVGTICLHTVECTIREGSYRFSKITRPTSRQQKALDLLGVYLKCRVKTLSLTDGMKPDQYRTALRQAQ